MFVLLQVRVPRCNNSVRPLLIQHVLEEDSPQSKDHKKTCKKNNKRLKII